MKITILSVLLLGVTSAYASDWEQVAQNDNMEVFLDKQSVGRQGKLRKAWLAYSFKAEQSLNGKIYKSTKQQEQFSCPEKASGQYQTTYYTDEYGKGQVVFTWMAQSKNIILSDVVPDSVGEAVLRAVCRISIPSV